MIFYTYTLLTSAEPAVLNTLRWQVRQEAAALLGEFGSARKQQLRRQQAPWLGNREGWLSVADAKKDPGVLRNCKG